MNNSAKRHKLRNSIFAVLFVLALVQIVYLMRQNRQPLQTLDRRLNPAPNPGDSPQPFAGVQAYILKPGDSLLPFSAPNATGREVKLAYDEEDYLLFITAANCSRCEQTLPHWKELAARARAGGSRVVAISLDRPEEIRSYAEKNGLSFEVVTFPDAKLKSSYKVYGAPLTILVRRGGRVEKVWRGELSEESKREIGTLLSPRFPAAVNQTAGWDGD